MKIIIADDEKDFGALMKTFLEKMGHEVTLDPDATLLIPKGNMPDLILIDINLRNKDGGDLCTSLKTNHHTKDIPVILISGIRDLKQISQYCGAQGFLIKPFEIADLKKVVERYNYQLS